MKRFIKSLIAIALVCGYAIPAMAQATTEGKRFWVALPFASGPSGIDLPEPFLAISAQKACTVTVSQPAGNWVIARKVIVADNSWTVLSNGDPSGDGSEATIATPNTPPIPNNVWFDRNWTINTASEPTTPFPYGLLVESTEDISLYAAMRSVASFDATNILPENTLQSDYILQDYPPYNSTSDEAHSLFVIVATEDHTVVDITPSTPTYKGKPAGRRFTVELNKGQTYQVIGKDQQTFSGTIVKERNNKKIAVFSGADFTRIPGAKSARDCLYEQAMPTDYWGTQFVVSRSMDKDANRVRITAQNKGTVIYIDGKMLPKPLDAGETYEFEMSENLATTDMASALSNIGREAPDIFTGIAHYIETSCPCAVFSYDVSRQYAHSTTTDPVGDPAMVWISPLEQRIKKITFGACGTKKCKSCSDKCWTNQHYVNIVCETSDIESFKLEGKAGAITVNFTPVPGNPNYSYARVFLVDTDVSSDAIFTMSNKTGFVAHVYGSGFNESYAYSVGSSAIAIGTINVDNQTFDAERTFSNDAFCVDDELVFDASAGTTIIDKVEWDFGDGTTDVIRSASTTHVYTSPGWFDVTAKLYAHKECPDTVYPPIPVKFTFRVTRPDTIPFDTILCADDVANYHFDKIPNTVTFSMADKTKDEIIVKDVSSTEDCSNVYRVKVIAIAKHDSIVDFDEIYPASQRQDGFWIPADGYNVPNPEHPEPEWVTAPGNYERHYLRQGTNCDSTVTYHVTIVKCLGLVITNDSVNQHACYGENYDIPYTYVNGGTPGDVFLVTEGFNDTTWLAPLQPVGLNNDGNWYGTITLPLRTKDPDKYKMTIHVVDVNCEDTAKSELLDVAVYYPETIFDYLFNNVLAVYDKGYGGNKNYTLTGFQWYRNGEAIEGADKPVYYTDSAFVIGDEYHVVLTNDKNVTLPSCPKTIQTNTIDQKPQNTQQSSAPAQKLLINRRMVIQKGEMMYDIYGQRVQ